MLEVCLFTALLSLAMHALPGLTINATDPANPERGRPRAIPACAITCCATWGRYSSAALLVPVAGHVAAWVVSVVFGFLLLSAVNTAIVALIAISFLMSRDGELPPQFQKLNQFGVPNLGLIVAAVIPALLVLIGQRRGRLGGPLRRGRRRRHCHQPGRLQHRRKLGLVTWERVLMFFTFLIMLAIEISLFVDKPSARRFRRGRAAGGLDLARLGRRVRAAAKDGPGGRRTGPGSLSPRRSHAQLQRQRGRPADDVRHPGHGQNAGFCHRRGAPDAPSALPAFRSIRCRC